MFNIGEESNYGLKNKKSLKDRLLGRKRWILGIILLFGNFCASSMRTHIGVSMVCMVNATAVHEMSEKSDIPQFLPEHGNSQCHRINVNETKAVIKGYKGTFVWSTEEQALLFSSGFYGNLLIMFFPGFLINHYGSKNVAFVCAVGMALTTALMPTLAFFGMYYFMAMRILFGIFEYSIYSALVAPLSLWFSPTERSTAAAIFTSGSPLASSLGVLITTNLCSLDLWNGWPLIFYYTSAVTFLWAVAWLAFFTNSPKKSRFLSIEEKAYLHEKNEGHSHPEGDKKKKMPLKKMLASAPVIAVMFATFNHVITTSLMQNYLPTYARDTLDLDLRSNNYPTADPPNNLNSDSVAPFQQCFQFLMQQMNLQQQQSQNLLQTPTSSNDQNGDAASVISSTSKSSTAVNFDAQELKTKIVLFNLKESYVIQDRNTIDVQNVKEIFKVMEVSPNIKKVIRLGKFLSHNKPRRLLVQLASEEEQKNVLQNSRKLKKDKKWKGISMQAFRPKEIIPEVVEYQSQNEISKEKELLELPKKERKSKPKIVKPPNPFIHFAAKDEGASSKMKPKEVNILVIGETGVGKSTWINGIANYMSFNTFDDALNAKKPVCLIPMNFNLYVGEKYEKVSVNMKSTIGERDKNEADSSTGQSSTQEPKVYRYITDTFVFNLIDTPGIGDTRGIEYDMENMRMVLKCLSNWDKIHGICILLKPNVPRLTLSLRYCIEELLVNLHKSSIPNISVVFTNSCNTLFKPGDTMTVLKKLFDDVKESGGNYIHLSSSNVFCIDNEAVRLLYAHQKEVNFEKAHIKNCSTSWSRTVDETFRFFDYVSKLTPHSASETKSASIIRECLIELLSILANLNEEILQNTKAFEQQNQRLKAMKIRVAEMQKVINYKAEFIQKIPLNYPVTVCCGPNCIETVRTPNSDKQETFYKRICCRQCPLRNVIHSQIGNPNLRQCTAFGSNGFCQSCGCSWQTHMQIWYSQKRAVGYFPSTKNQDEIDHLNLQINAKTNYILQQKINLHHLLQRYHIIIAASQPYFEFLRQNSIIPLNSSLQEYLEFSIEECEKTLKPEDDRNELENLKKLLAINQQQKLLANPQDQLSIRAANSSSQKITFANYVEKITSLKNNDIIGSKLEESNIYQNLFKTAKSKVVEIRTNIESNNNVLDKSIEDGSKKKKQKSKKMLP